MANPNSQPTQVPATSAASPTPAQQSPIAPQNVDGQRATLASVINPTVPILFAVSNAAQLNTPLAGSLNSKPPLFYIKASVSQLKAIIHSAPEAVRNRIRANASKEAILDEVLKLRQQEALAASQQRQEAIDPHEALRKLMTMDTGDIPTAVDTNPVEVRKLMQAALQADSTLAPRSVPEDRHNMIYTVLTWQVNTHRSANPSCLEAFNQEPAQASPVPDQRPPTLPRSARNAGQGISNAPTTAGVTRQAAPISDQPVPSLQDILGLAPDATRGIVGLQRGLAQARDLQDVEDSDEDPDSRRKRARDNPPVESWIEGFHTGADAALEQTLSSYPENRPGANRLNVNSFRGPQILAKIINRNMGLQQHIASFPFWKKSITGKASQAHMEAHNIARMMQLEILAHSSPLEALRHRPSLEVGLRRLYAIMYVEKQVATGEMPDRGSAWQNIEFLLESTPTDVSTCDDIGRDDSASDTVQAAHCGNQSHHRVRPAAQQAGTQQQEQNRQPRREQTPQPGRGDRQATGVTSTLTIPSSKSNTFPIPPVPELDKLSQAANTAIGSLNMLYSGPPHTHTNNLTSPRSATTHKAARAVKNAISRMPQPDGKQGPSDSAAILAEAPSYVLLPALREIFDNPELAARKGQFCHIQAESLDLPPTRDTPNQSAASLWLSHLPPPLAEVLNHL